ncbi:hypothetical protein WOLCODRAFT_160324 [Wolfiporia cocos MD-104 SS10]|uniref:Uncharacterized protein n=1 Tax=Wolfiporia cocos (strain MD-104) TaxID=742152 RepID=A0A2H3IUV6_WOLCO|nr:hypothetical protein WOLCODRAFT_160324 [Wolfiporia cocos MD-104 SS10]
MSYDGRSCAQASSSSCVTLEFNNRHHFTHKDGQWYCNVCAGVSREPMSTATAVQHERSRAHATHVQEHNHFNPQPNDSGWKAEAAPSPLFDLKEWEKQGRVDSLKDFVPFWREGVMAAERGEEAGRMEDYFARVDEQWNKRRAEQEAGGWGGDLGVEIWGGDGWGDAPAWDTAGWGWDGAADKPDRWGAGKAGWGVSTPTASDRVHGWNGENPCPNDAASETYPKGVFCTLIVLLNPSVR